jgi:hypothetical protein
MRGLGLVATASLVLLLSAALPLCSAVPDTVEWPRPSVGTPPKMNAMSLAVAEMTDVGEANVSGALYLKVVDANGTAVGNATVFTFSSEEAEFDRAKAVTGADGLARFNFTLLVEPYAGMSVVASAMKPGYENADVLVYFAGEATVPVEPSAEDVRAPSLRAEDIITIAAVAVSSLFAALYIYWSKY